MTANNVTKVTQRGQVSIPAELRKEMELDRGRRLLWERVSERELRVRVLSDSTPARGAEAMRGFARRFRDTPRRTADWMTELREGEDD